MGVGAGVRDYKYAPLLPVESQGTRDASKRGSNGWEGEVERASLEARATCHMEERASKSSQTPQTSHHEEPGKSAAMWQVQGGKPRERTAHKWAEAL